MTAPSRSAASAPTPTMQRVARLLAILVGSFAGHVAAQDPPSEAQPPETPPSGGQGPLVTDRPDFTESTDAVPPGRFQLEAGYTFTYDRERGQRIRSHTAPELLGRIGLADNFELRVGWSGYNWNHQLVRTRNGVNRRVTVEDHEQGADDVILGFKLKLLEQDGWQPHFGIIGEISVPSGSFNTSSGDVDPGIKLLWAYDLTDRLAIAGNVNLAVPTEDAHRFVQAGASLSLAASLTERLGTYIEYFGTYPAADGQDAAHSLNGGFTFLVHDDFQLDARVGVGLNEQADDFFTGVGFAWRF